MTQRMPAPQKIHVYRLKDGEQPSGNAVGHYDTAHFRATYWECKGRLVTDVDEELAAPSHGHANNKAYCAILALYDLTGTQPLPKVADWLEPWPPSDE